MRSRALGFAVAALAATASLAAADPLPAAIAVDVAAAAAPSQWRQASARLASCEPLVVTLWYAFGSMRVTTTARPHGCELTIRREVEQGAADVQRCHPAPGRPWSWDPLQADGRRLARPPAPPAQLACAPAAAERP